MNTHADKIQENKTQSVVNSVTQKQGGGESTFQFVDNRREAIARRKMQEAFNDSPRVKQLRAYQEMGNDSRQVKQLSAYQTMVNNSTSQKAQRKENLEEETLQGKLETVQKKENNTGLPDNLKTGIENLSGYSMDDIKVYYHSSGAIQRKANHAKTPKVVLKKNNNTSALKNSNVPIQTVNFSRYFSGLYNNTDEKNLLAKEKEVEEFFNEMKKYALRFPEITQLGVQLNQIKIATVDSKDYDDTKQRLNDIKQRLDSISTKIALVGVTGGDEMMDAFGKNAEDSKVGRIIKIYLDTVRLLPVTMKTKNNRMAIKNAIHPDAENSAIGYTDQYLGDSDVAFAEKRHQQIVINLFALIRRVDSDWAILQHKFGLVGGVKEISLTGSDLHKSGQQVVIIESEGGQKVVYKPRSTAPDAALMDSQSGIFPMLNKKGTELPTMDFYKSESEGSYVQFVHQQKLKTQDQIKKYYYQMGQLAVAAKLFGVNDLHYENIMAAANGPTIIDGETSFLLNVMTARDFQSNELQKGVFEHVSEIDQKLSNNSFYTIQEKHDWENLAPAGKPSWDKYIGSIRDQDVRTGGLFEADLKRGISSMLTIVRTNRKTIVNDSNSTIKNIDNVRVVPLATSEFKKLMSSYRDHKRFDNERGLTGTIENAKEQVAASLHKKGYFLQNSRSVKMLLKEDFDGGDIPILHYNGKSNQLVWNNRIIGTRKDYKKSKNVVGQNVKWILRQSVDDIIGSLQG